MARPGADTSPYTDADYFAHVDGKPRYDGVRDLLTARGIRLPEGDPSDPPERRHRVRPGQPQERRLQRRARARRRHGLPRLGRAARRAARAADAARGRLVVGQRARRARGGRPRRPVRRPWSTAGSPTALGLPGKPAPDTFVHAATECGTAPARSVVVEDAVSGVRAGAAGAFGLVIGVDRGAGADALTAAGADLVVADLGDLA